MDSSTLVATVGRQRKDSLGIVLESDEAVAALLGWTATDLRGRRILEFLHPDDREQAVRSFMSMLKGQSPIPPTRARHRHKDGHYVDISITNRNVLATEGFVVTEIALAPPEPDQADPDSLEENGSTAPRSATNRIARGTEEPDDSPRLFASLVATHERTLRAIVESLPAGIIQIAANKCVTLTNTRASLLLGAKNAHSVEDLFGCVVEEDRPLLRHALRDVLGEAAESEIELRIAVPGRPALSVISISFRALTEPGTALNGAILCVEDATDRARTRELGDTTATVDQLTGCLNRASTVNAVRSAIRLRQDVAVLFVDIDRMKTINDHYGTTVGDRVIASMARRLSAAKRIGDLVGRVAGDKFVVICPRTTLPENGVTIARRFAQVLCQPTEVGQTTLNVSISIGIAHASTAGLDAGQILAAAESGSIEAKRYRDGEPVLFDPAEHPTPSSTTLRPSSIDPAMAAALR